MSLGFKLMKAEDSGNYECASENRIASVRKSVYIEVTSNLLLQLILSLIIFIIFEYNFSSIETNS
jgi:hypothetical protein